jgi:hypothetical protein
VHWSRCASTQSHSELPHLHPILCLQAAREERILAIGKCITTLWGRLSTPVEEQTAFMESHCGLGDAVIAAVRMAAPATAAATRTLHTSSASCHPCSARRTLRACDPTLPRSSFTSSQAPAQLSRASGTPCSPDRRWVGGVGYLFAA